MPATAWRRLSPYFRTTLGAYRALRWLIASIIRVLFRYSAEGLENIPPTGPVILVVNHLHLIDPAVVAAAVHRKIVTLATSKWRTNVLIAAFLKVAGVIFVRRGEVDRRALKACLDVLGRGEMLALAPEGTRSRTGGLGLGKPGVAYIAHRADAVIVPVAHWGVERFRELRHLRRLDCHVVIGKPFRLPELAGRVTTEQLQEMADLVMVQIGQYLPESYRGVYAEQIAAYLAGLVESPSGLRVSPG